MDDEIGAKSQDTRLEDKTQEPRKAPQSRCHIAYALLAAQVVVVGLGPARTHGRCHTHRA